MTKSVLFCTGIYPPDIGGPATYVLRLAQQMDQDGIRVGVITYSDNHSGTEHSFHVTRIKRRFFALNYLRYFYAVIRNAKNYDVLYIQGSFSEGIPTILANIFLRKKTIMRIGGIFSWELSTNLGMTRDLPEDFFHKKQRFFCEILKKIDNLVISNCDKVVANSNYMKKILTLNRIKPGKISVIYNSFDPMPETEAPYAKDKSLERAFDASNKTVLLSHGRFVPWKNFDKLILFFKELPGNHILIIVGEGPEEEKLKNLIRNESLEKKVFLLPKQSKSELRKLNNFADIFVLISSYEGLSNALVEAVQLDCKIISSDIEPNAEVLKGYETCKIIPIKKEFFIRAVSELEAIQRRTNPQKDTFDFALIYKKTLSELCT